MSLSSKKALGDFFDECALEIRGSGAGPREKSAQIGKTVVALPAVEEPTHDLDG